MAIVFSAVIALIGTIIFQSTPADRIARKTVMIHPPAYVEHMTLGYRDLVADSLWIRLIQDYDLCEASNVNIYGGAVGRKCSEGWIYRMVDAITSLSPRFRMPYATGATIMTVLIEDYVGAEKIFEKAEKNFPKDYVFPYRAAYNYIYGLNQPLKASQALVRAAGLEGAPLWLPMLAARMAKQGGHAELGLRILEDLASDHPDWEENPRLHELKKDLLKLQKAEMAAAEGQERSPTSKQNSKTP